MADNSGIKMYFVDPENCTQEEREMAIHILTNYLGENPDDPQRRP